MTVYARPGTADALMSYESRYANFIGGDWLPPVGGEYFENPTPVTRQTFTEIPRAPAGAGERLRPPHVLESSTRPPPPSKPPLSRPLGPRPGTPANRSVRHST